MKRPKKCCVLILAATILAIGLRLPWLEQRPMHGDEAVNAVKFGDLLEEGSYQYDPDEYHGPTLNYLTLIPAWLSSDQKLSDLSEFTLRIVPVFFGVLLVLLLLLLVGGLGRGAAIVAAVLIAVSPAFVFYSRYYIHEMLLVCFTFGVITCGYRYTQSKNITWALLTGMFLGLMQATKETCIIAFASILLALLLTFLMLRRQQLSPAFVGIIKPVLHSIVMVVTAAIVSVLFYSSFRPFTITTEPFHIVWHMDGPLDSLRAYATYFSRAGQDGLHIHPWYYYLKMLIYFRVAGGPVWSEALIVLLAGVGFVVAITRKGIAVVNFHLFTFIAFYTLIMTVLYSVIPYKTPWCLLGFLHGMILLAAVGAVAVIKLAPNVLPRLIVILLLLGGGAHLAWQGYLGSYKYYADPTNPYVYAHPVPDVVTIAERVKEIAQVHPDGYEMHIQVICPEHDHWPLPWYLRRFEKGTIDWWDKVADDVPAAPVIIASPSVEQELMRKLYELPPPGKKNLYVPLFDSYMELRPQVELRGYVTKDLWDSYQQHQVQSVLTQSKSEK
jgi:uncharacterized protein (TIGR03663 family)